MAKHWGIVVCASFAALAVLTASVVVIGRLPGEWVLVTWAIGTRSDWLTRAIWALTFISSAVPTWARLSGRALAKRCAGRLSAGGRLVMPGVVSGRQIG
ncbi:MAG: hypothetical protein K6U78_13100 [Anaerolineae bacterium]|nr:hypothetical protein [Anaerolineae bacterium]